MLALSSQILFTMSRHAMTDILQAAAGMCAFAILLFDPELASIRGLVGFIVAVAAAITAKSIAGILPLAVLGVMMLASRRRPSWTRAIVAGVGAIALASPWFLYNYLMHRDWFLADMGFQLITIGTAVHQTSNENHLWFYVLRVLESDLLPLLLAVTAVPALIRSMKQREHTSILAAAYLIVYFAAIMVFRFNSEQYLCWLVPALILIAGLYSPLANRVALVALVVFAIKLAYPGQPWGVSIGSGTTLAAAPVLDHYCTEHRATTLYVIGVDDEFLSAVLPLQKVRYAWADPTNLVGREHPHLAYLGILLPIADAENPVFRDRLRNWGLGSSEAVGTGMWANDNAGLAQFIREHPESDFLVSRAIVQSDANHTVDFANSDFILLEAIHPVRTSDPKWSCEM